MFTWALLVLTGGLVNEAVGQAFLTCHVPGVATGPNCITLDTLYEVATPNDCIDICQAENDCDWWSWIPSQNPTQPTACWMSQNPCSVNDTACPDCISGQQGCSKLFECNLPGQCQGSLVAVVYDAISADDCLVRCKANDACQWYSYNRREEICYQFSSCPSLNSCATCVSGERNCDTNNAELGYHTLFLTAGYNQNSKESEAFVLVGSESCDPLPDFPDILAGPGGGFLEAENAIFVCGGLLNTYTPRDTCYKYTNESANRWQVLTSPKLTSARGYVATTKMDNDRMWISGGYIGTGFTTDTDIFDGLDNKIESGPPLPIELGEHCIIKVSETEYVLISGHDTFDYPAEIYMYDFASASPGWVLKSATLATPRRGAHCGLVTQGDENSQTKLVVVAAGIATDYVNSIEIYDVTADTMINTAKTFPVDSSHGPSIPYGNSFIAVVGGDGTGDPSKPSIGNMYLFDPDDLEFRIISEKATGDHFFGTGFLLPDDYLTCS